MSIDNIPVNNNFATRYHNKVKYKKEEVYVFGRMTEEYIEIDGWKSGLRFSACHMIPHHKKCNRLHGHTWVVNVRIYGTKKKDNEMIIDFGICKTILQNLIKEFDHKVIIGKHRKNIKIEKSNIIVIENGKEYMFPVDDVIVLPINSATCENITEYICDQFISKLRELKYNNLTEIEVGVDEGWGQGVWIKKKIKR